MKSLALFVVTIFSLAFTSTATADKIVKWVDKNGVVHYGDKAPLPAVSKKSQVLNRQGVTVGTIDHTKKKATHNEAEKKQSRKDAALLASYTSIEEIEVAKERNTKLDKLAVVRLEDKLTKLNGDLEKNVMAQKGYILNEKTVPKTLLNEEQDIHQKINKTKKRIEVKKQDIKIMSQRYDDDKKRYEALKTMQLNKANQ